MSGRVPRAKWSSANSGGEERRGEERTVWEGLDHEPISGTDLLFCMAVSRLKVRMKSQFMISGPTL